jgi:hypothetical protein
MSSYRRNTNSRRNSNDKRSKSPIADKSNRNEDSLQNDGLNQNKENIDPFTFYNNNNDQNNTKDVNKDDDFFNMPVENTSFTDNNIDAYNDLFGFDHFTVVNNNNQISNVQSFDTFSFDIDDEKYLSDSHLNEKDTQDMFVNKFSSFSGPIN